MYRHLEILKNIYLVDEIPGWVPAARSPLRMRTKPKLYFADPSLAVGLLGGNSSSLLQDWQTFGLVFENLVMRDLGVYARALPNVSDQPLKYYRDDAGLEVDAIIERADGSWAAIEVKLSQEKVEAGAKSLLQIAQQTPEGRALPHACASVHGCYNRNGRGPLSSSRRHLRNPNPISGRRDGNQLLLFRNRDLMPVTPRLGVCTHLPRSGIWYPEFVLGFELWRISRFGTPISANFGDLVPRPRRNAWSRFARAAFAGTKPSRFADDGYKLEISPRKGTKPRDPAAKTALRGTKPSQVG